MEKTVLVKRCQEGDRDALALLYQTYLPPMRKVVAYYIHNSDTVEDILHDGFLIAFTSICSLRNESKVKGWLTTIMKNLSLQYLREKSDHTYVSMSGEEFADDSKELMHEDTSLTLDELNIIIDKLPEGYGKVFRLAVLDGLSHKEIGVLLGIAPNSSSSQLTRAKAMLRRMILQHRAGMLFFVVICSILLLNQKMQRREIESMLMSVADRHTDYGASAVSDSIYEGSLRVADSIVPPAEEPRKEITLTLLQESIADVAVTGDSISAPGANDSAGCGTVRMIPDIIDRGELIARENFTRIPRREVPGWSMSLAYAGGRKLSDLNRYRIPNPDASAADPDGGIEITEKTRHHMPLVIGLYINKPLTSRWSVGTGARYTFLRSEFLYESVEMNRRTVQRIHYIGVPLKFNYRMFTYGGLSLYGHGGGALDIPVSARQTIREYSPSAGNPVVRALRIHAPLQWSVEAGLGIQYHLTPSFSIYAEPSFRYYFNPGTDVRTIRQDKPSEFTVPVGLRITL